MNLTSLKAVMLGASAALALTACGGDKEDDAQDTATESRAERVRTPSPLDEPFVMADAQPLDVEGFLGAMEGEGFAYGTASFDEEIGATVLTDVKPAADQDVTIGRIELYGVNEEAIATIAADEPMEDMTELFRMVRLFDVKASFPVNAMAGSDISTELAAAAQEGEDSAEGEDGAAPEETTEDAAPVMGTVTIGAMQLGAVKLRKPAITATEEEGGEPLVVGTDMGPDDIALGGMAMKDFALAIPFAEGGKVDVNTPDLRIKKFGAGKFEGMYIADMAFELVQSPEAIEAQLAAMGPQAAPLTGNPLIRNLLFPEQQSGKVSEIVFDGFSVEGLMPYLENGEKPPVDATDLIKIGQLEFLGQESYVNGKKSGFIGRQVIEPIDFYHFMPKKIRITSEDATTDLTALVGDDNPEVLGVLTENGLDNMQGEGSFTYEFDPDNQTIAMDAVSKTEGFADFTVDLDVSSFNYDALASGEEANAQMALMGTAINGLTIRLDDEKMLDTIFGVIGAAQGQEPSALRQQVVGLMTIGALQGAQISPRIADYSQALSSFITDGGTLEIAIAPEEPVTGGQVAAAAGAGNPAAVLDTLNLTVSQK